MQQTRRRFIKAAMLGIGGGLAAMSRRQGKAAEQPAFPVAPLTIETARGRFQFLVEIAETPTTWRQGLQKRRELPLDAGMLFNYHQPRVASMWMKDTLIALDMVFIDERGAIVQVVENTVPLSEATISSAGPVLAVLEVNAGTAGRLGIKPGDRVYHAIFAAAAARTNP